MTIFRVTWCYMSNLGGVAVSQGIMDACFTYLPFTYKHGLMQQIASMGQSLMRFSASTHIAAWHVKLYTARTYAPTFEREVQDDAAAVVYPVVKSRVCKNPKAFLAILLGLWAAPGKLTMTCTHA